MKVRDNGNLVLCDNCDTPASWEMSVKLGWIGCMPCITGEADSFDDSDLIALEYKKQFVEEMKAQKGTP